MLKNTNLTLLKICLSLLVILIVCEITDTKHELDKRTPIIVLQAATAEVEPSSSEQYIPPALNYSEVIKQIKAEEGVVDEEQPKTAEIPDNTEDNNYISTEKYLTPTEYLDAAKDCVRLALMSESEQKKKLKVRQALKYYKEYLKYFPSNIEGLLGAGAMAIFLGKEDEARNILMEAYATYPKNPDVHKALGDYSFKFSNFNNAIEYYNLSLLSGNLEDYATNLATAICYEKLGEIDKAKEYFKTARYLNPDSTIANQRLQMYERLEQQGYQVDSRAYKNENYDDEKETADLEVLLLESHQYK